MWCQFVGSVDGEQLPVHLPVVDHCQTAENFHPFQGPHCGRLVDIGADLTDVKRVVIAVVLLAVNINGKSWVFPGLRHGAVVAGIAVERIYVVDESWLAFLGVLNYWVERQFFRNLELSLLISWDFHDHVNGALCSVVVERDVVEEGLWTSFCICKVLFELESVLPARRYCVYVSPESSKHA